MKRDWNITTDAALVGQYVDSLPARQAARDEPKLRSASTTLQLVLGDQSCLQHTYTTAWIPSWTLAVSSPAARISQIQSLGRWWSWLFDRHILDDNVLACFYPYAQVLHEPSTIVLSHNLQRTIEDYLDQHGPRKSDSRQMIRKRLASFNLFLHRLKPQWDGSHLDEDLILEWLRFTCDGGPATIGFAAGALSGFLDFLVQQRRFLANPLRDLRSRYGRRRRGDVLAALIGKSDLRIEPVVAGRCFVSLFAPQLEAFVSLKRAMGLRYDATVQDLQRFDRFALERMPAADIMTPEIVDAWLASGRHLSAKNQKKRLGLIRQFCLYLKRFRADTYVPDHTLLPIHVSLSKTYVYSPDEYRALLKAALALPAPRSTLRPLTFYTVLLVLYATGLRIGEALRLRLRDVDLEAAIITVRETKFGKSRVVPFSPPLGDALRVYLEQRLVATIGPSAPFFINHEGRPYSVDKFSEVFRTLLPAAGIRRVPGKPGPRVYDVRHTFARTRVLKWYRDGADLQSKLPLLATYMGHVDVLSTQVYLRSTPELLREASSRFERMFGGLVVQPQEVHDGTR
jgi:integrase/recombinase XerD